MDAKRFLASCYTDRNHIVLCPQAVDKYLSRQMRVRKPRTSLLCFLLVTSAHIAEWPVAKSVSNVVSSADLEKFTRTLQNFHDFHEVLNPLPLYCHHFESVIFQLTGTESKPIQLTRTRTENWPSKRTGIEITSYRIE